MWAQFHGNEIKNEPIYKIFYLFLFPEGGI